MCSRTQRIASCKRWSVYLSSTLELCSCPSVSPVVVHLLSHVWLFATLWTSACQASLSVTISRSLLKLTFIELVMPSNHLILCHPLLLLPSIFPSIKVFSNESLLRIRWPKYWSFSFSSSPSNDYSRLISFMIDWFNLLLKIPGMWIPGIHQKHLLITQRLVCQTHCSKREHLQIK